MKDNTKEYKPNVFLLIIGTSFFLFAIICVIFSLLKHQQDLGILDLSISLILCLIFNWWLLMCIDTWVVRIQKDSLSIRRLWSSKWTKLNADEFKDIKYSVGLDDHLILYKKLTLVTADNKKYNFYSFTDNLYDELFTSILKQTPKLLDKYKKRKNEINNKINKRIGNYSREILLSLFLLLCLIIWTRLK